MKHLISLAIFLMICGLTTTACSSDDSNDSAATTATAGDGTDGTDGADATDGTDGADATDGTDGADATDGTDGADATDGTDGADATDGTDGADATDGTDGTDGGTLKWYSTCGDPVCQGHTPQKDVGECGDKVKEGDACDGMAGEKCDPVNDCNSHLLCTNNDPKSSPGGCPKSRKATKTEIRHLNVKELRQLHTELQRMKLAKYKYLDEVAPKRERLGFIMEEVEPSVAVDSARSQVDIYGFASMAVAALQVQAVEIETLKTELKKLSTAVEKLSTK